MQGQQRVVDYLVHTGELGGAERSLLALLAALPPVGVAPRLACPAGELVEAAAALGLAHLPVPFAPVRLSGGPAQWPASLWRLWGNRRLWAGVEKSPLVHANSHRAALYALGQRGPLVMHLREALGHGPAGRLIRRVLRRHAPAVVANSRFSLDNLTLGKPWPAPTLVLPNPLDAAAFALAAQAPLPVDLNLPPDAIVLLLVGNLAPNKGQDRLIQALAKGGEALKAVHVVLAGGVMHNPAHARFADTLAPMARALGVAERVHLVGHQASVAPFFGLAHGVVIPSEMETFGRVVLEAAAVKKPVLAHAVGGLTELVHHARTGYGYRGSLTAALSDFVRARHMWPQWAGAAHQQVLPPSDPQRVAQTLADFYDKVQRKRQSSQT